jgi:hypothetical protein
VRVVPFLAALGVIAGIVSVPMTLASASGRAPSATDALPRARELLPQPIALRHCGRIVEWKPTDMFRDETSPSSQALAEIDDACRTAIERYPDFLRHNRLPFSRTAPESMPPISLLPGNILVDGRDARNLNDLPGRFGAVTERCCYWGLYVDAIDHLFVRNDPLLKDSHTGALRANPRFLRTLYHELAHVLNSRLGVLPYIDRRRDEELAEEFVGFLGITFSTESSSDDLAFHEGRR